MGTKRADTAARTEGRSRPDEKGKTAEPVKAAPAKAEPVGTRRSRHSVTQAPAVRMSDEQAAETRRRAQAQRDEWLRRINTKPAKKP